MTRFFGLLGLSALLLVNVGCGTMCHKRAPSCPPSPAFVAPPPPAPLVPAGGVTFGPPAQSFPPAQNFPTAPAQNFPSAPAQNFPTAPGAAFGQPDAPFPKAPPSITPMPPNNVQPRFESKWQPGENPDVKPRVNADVQPRENPDVKPRVQLYAPEAVPDRPRITEDPPAAKRPGATFPAIPQFAEVKANVYSGLRPGAAGLDWLQSNRLGTVVNIRLAGEDDATDRKETEARGLRYVAVEVSPQNLTKEGFDAFIKLIRENAEKGVFVYDRDGSLAGPIWYLYLRWGEFLDDDAAQLRARSLGLQTTRDGAQRDMWLAVQKLLSENNR
jgi:protein tyrosine phosphatase (PTP) superfamily phosphohydrolase (DUF442 family)